MNICVITSSFPLNEDDSAAAAGLFVRDFCLAVSGLGHRVIVVTPERSGKHRRDTQGLDVRWFPWRGGHKPLSTMKPYKPSDALDMLSLFRQGGRALVELTAEQSIDHVLAMWAVPAGYMAADIKRRRGIPFTTWCLGSDIWVYGKFPISRNLVARVIRNSNLVYADGIALGKAVEKMSGRPCPFLPSSRKLRTATAGKPQTRHDGLNVLFVGRYHRVKGADILLDAFAKFLQSGQKGHLTMYGGGPEERTLRRKIANLDVDKSVTIHKFAAEPVYLSALAACDVFVIPSRMESIPVVLSDAVQMGKPLIVSDVGDMAQLVHETGAGIVVPPEDPDRMCDALIEISSLDRSTLTPGVTALAQRFDIDRTAAAWLDDVQRLAKS